MDKLTSWLPLAVILIAGRSAILQIRINHITNARLRWLEALKEQLGDCAKGRAQVAKLTDSIIPFK